MRELIAAFKISADGRIECAQGPADWVDGWSDDYGLTAQVDACVLGGRMYPGYEQYWTQIQNHPDEVHPLSGSLPTAAEVEWAKAMTALPHYVVSKSLTSTAWPDTTVLHGLDDVEALKHEDGKDIYLMGGARITAAALDAGLVDEVRLIVYPLLAGEGPALFATSTQRRALELRSSDRWPDGRLSLVYRAARA